MRSFCQSRWTIHTVLTMVQSVRGRREGRGGRYRKVSIDEGRGAQAQPPLLHLRDNVVDISSDDSIQSPNVGLDDTIDDGNAAHRNVDIEGDNVVDISSDDSTQSLNVGLDDTMDDGNAAHRSVDIEGDNVVDISSDDSTQSPNVGLDDTMDDDNAAHRRVEIEDMATRKRGRGTSKGHGV
ncbi:hypothetical protein I3842_04G130900 [Carya illinoinensis]|uniref:Uncharacterized protein n=1 Tax=Carya illinoinensis TaxID=32201 RepID=A0A922F8H6_CARIL|nr:hypothetical protein I3842_04G130900 [Carya illinoinensis]